MGLARPIFTVARARPMVLTKRPKRCFCAAKTVSTAEGGSEMRPSLIAGFSASYSAVDRGVT